MRDPAGSESSGFSAYSSYKAFLRQEGCSVLLLDLLWLPYASLAPPPRTAHAAPSCLAPRQSAFREYDMEELFEDPEYALKAGQAQGDEEPSRWETVELFLLSFSITELGFRLPGCCMCAISPCGCHPKISCKQRKQFQQRMCCFGNKESEYRKGACNSCVSGAQL